MERYEDTSKVTGEKRMPITNIFFTTIGISLVKFDMERRMNTVMTIIIRYSLQSLCQKLFNNILIIQSLRLTCGSTILLSSVLDWILRY